MDLDTSIREWLAGDPSDVDKAELLHLSRDELAHRFSSRLTFGTAGLRGQIGAGPNRMNRAVVMRVTAAVAATVRQTVPHPSAIVGFDARHRSAEFAQATAEVLAGAGFSVQLIDAPTPTPVLAQAARAGNHEVGVMITASHNPATDNGYKVYLGGQLTEPEFRSAQLVAPWDEQIAAAIETTPPANQLVTRAPDIVSANKLEHAYVNAVTKQIPSRPRTLAVVLTAMHGVGYSVAERVLNRVGFTNIIPVTQQQHPDPKFPTVQFPNPEEPGALDLAMATSSEADLILALDPDADRCSAAIPNWRQLTGDEIGAILGENFAKQHSATEPSAIANTIVSSTLLCKIAGHHGLKYHRTLTGFKWLARTPNLAFAYEEAIGYCVQPNIVRDKDGIATAMLLAIIADDLHQSGRTLSDAYDEIELRHGVHTTSPLTFRLSSTDEIQSALEKLAHRPPTQMGGETVAQITDLSHGSDHLPATPGLRLETNTSWTVVRPSGTEPKLKCYLEVRVTGELNAARKRAANRLADIKRALSQALELNHERK